MTYESYVDCESTAAPDVRYRVARMSFARRLDLTRRVRDLLTKLEYFEAGKDAREEVAASLLKLEIDSLYLQWGLLAVEGLHVEGVAPAPFDLVSAGPEGLAREVIQRIKAEAGLSEIERKN